MDNYIAIKWFFKKIKDKNLRDKVINKARVKVERVTIYNFKKAVNIAFVVYKRKKNVRMTSLNKDRIEVINTVVNRFNYDLEKSLNKIALFTSKFPTAKATYNKDFF